MPLLPEGPLHIDLAVGAMVTVLAACTAARAFRVRDPSLGYAAGVAVTTAWTEGHYLPVLFVAALVAAWPLLGREIDVRTVYWLIAMACAAAISYAIVPDTEWAVAAGSGSVVALPFAWILDRHGRSTIGGLLASVAVAVASIVYGTAGRVSRLGPALFALLPIVVTVLWSACRNALDGRASGHVGCDDGSRPHRRTRADAAAG